MTAAPSALQRPLLRLLGWISDLRLAIGLLLLIALASGVGTAIPQKESATFYHQRYDPSPWLGLLRGEPLVVGLLGVARDPRAQRGEVGLGAVQVLAAGRHAGREPRLVERLLEHELGLLFALAQQQAAIKPNSPFVLRSPEWTMCAVPRVEERPLAGGVMTPGRALAGQKPV